MSDEPPMIPPLRGTTARERRRPSSRAAFWDTSAIVPLCCYQPQTQAAARLSRRYPRQIAWWASATEATSALHRLQREGALRPAGVVQARARLEYLRHRWNEVLPTDDVRHGAERLLGIHPLRAADAFQLAAALVWCGGRTRNRPFIAGDGALAAAAAVEGFTVLGV
jgi:uncharacterized protein